MYYSYDINCQLERIMKRKEIFNDFITPGDQYIQDVYDGDIYKKFLNSEEGKLVKINKAFTFSINTDGISRCEKSDLDIWPVYLVINEIKCEYRYCIENVIIAGKITICYYCY